MPTNSPKLVRQVVSLTVPQYTYMRQRAEALGITVSELTRRIVDEHRDTTQGDHDGHQAREA